MFRILVVCTGNVCRSPMGEGILKHLLAQQGLADRVDVRSAGTWGSSGSAASDFAVRAAAEHGIRIESHRSSPLRRSLVREADLILAMEPAHLEEILVQEPDASDKAFLVTTFADAENGDPGGVEDPFGADLDSYRTTYEEVDHLLRLGLPRVLRMIQESDGAPKAAGSETDKQSVSPRRATDGR